jgi:hypothetical protein
MTYNATVYRTMDDRTISVFVAEVDSAGYMLRSNAVQCTGLEGTREYDAYFERNCLQAGETISITKDGGEGYRARLRGYSLPGLVPLARRNARCARLPGVLPRY